MTSEDRNESGEGSEDDFELMVERLLAILENYSFGAKAELIRQKYEEKYSTKLPQHWLRTLKDVPEIDVTGLGSIVCLCAAKPKTEKSEDANLNGNRIDAPPQNSQTTTSTSSSLGSKKKVRLAMNLMEEKIFDDAQNESTDPEISPDTPSVSTTPSVTNTDSKGPNLVNGVEVFPGSQTARITSWTSVSNFGIRLTRHEQAYQDLKAALAQSHSQLTDRYVAISQGDLLAACYKGNWLRALALTGDMDGRIRALLIDSAVAALIPTSDFQRLDPQFLNHPALGLHAIGVGIDEQLESAIRSKMGDEQFVDVDVNILSSHLMKEGITEVKVKLVLQNPLKNNLPTSNGHSRNIDTTSPGRKTSLNLSTVSSSNEVPDSPRQSTPDQPRLLPLTKFREKKSFEVVPVFAPDPSEFTVIPTSCYPLFSSYIKDRLAEASEDAALELKEDEPRVGSFYAGFDEETGEWRRVYYSGPVNSQPGMLRVFLVDSGEFRFLSSRQLRQLPKALMEAPEFMLAVKCELVGVSPIGGKARMWGCEASDQFRARAEGQLMVVEPVGDMEMWNNENCPSLPKINVKMKDAKGNDFAEWLVNNGFAVKSSVGF